MIARLFDRIKRTILNLVKHVRTGYKYMTLHFNILLRAKKIFHIHNDQHFRIYQIIVFPTLYSELGIRMVITKYGSFQKC